MSVNPPHASSPVLASTISPHGIVTPVQENREKHTGKAGASWKANEQHVLPPNRLWIVFPGLMCCVFLAALDQVRSQLCLFSADRRFTHCNTDHRCNCFTNHRRTSRPGKRLQLGRKVSLTFFFLTQFDSEPLSQFLPPCGQRARPVVRKVI